MQDQQLGCKCPSSVCNPENCDHVYLFDDDHVNAKDVNGNSMHSRFAYDEKGRIVLEVLFVIILHRLADIQFFPY